MKNRIFIKVKNYSAVAVIGTLLLFVSLVQAQQPAKQTFATTPDGVSIAIQEYGNPNGAEIVLIHGLLGSHLNWIKHKTRFYDTETFHKFSQRMQRIYRAIKKKIKNSCSVSNPKQFHSRVLACVLILPVKSISSPTFLVFGSRCPPNFSRIADKTFSAKVCS